MKPEGRSGRGARLLTLLLFLAGCAGAEPPRTALPSAPSFEELKQKIARIRGLDFQQEILLEPRRFEEIRALVEKSVIDDYGREPLEQTAKVFARLGLYDEAIDLAKPLAELRFFEQPFHYDPRRGALSLPQGAIKPNLPFLASPWRPGIDSALQLLEVHALAHVLQDQHFARRENLRQKGNRDMGLALSALMKGDAVLVGLEQFLGEGGENKQKTLDGLKEVFRFEEQINRDLYRVPEMLRREAAFQYVQGSQFVMWAYSQKDWEGVNRLYSRPPLSTSQILHPEKYYLRKQNPVRVVPWGLFRQVPGVKIVEETLGELLIQILLGRTLSRDEAMKAASGWAGDSFLVFQQGDGMVLAWTTVWENHEEAAEFFQSYRRALERRHGDTLEKAGASSDSLRSPARSKRPLFLQVKDNFVFFLDGIPHPRSGEIAEALWNELDIDIEGPAPFEIGSAR